jgi:flagellar basal-body rod modification protein FlgD
MNVGNVLTRAYQGQNGSLGGALTSLDVDQFLNLLIAQMRYQNPLEPQTESEYLSQLAQLSAVQELRDLNDLAAYSTQAQSIAQASSLIGKTVEGTSYIDGSRVSGVVSAVTSDGGATLLVVGDDLVEIGDVTGTWSQSAYDALSDAASLMGAHVMGVDSADGSTVVEGTVVSVNTSGGAVYLELEGDQGTAYVRADRLVSRGSADAAKEFVSAGWLIGHSVEVEDSENPGRLVTGQVDGLALKDQKVYVSVGGALYDVTGVARVLS